MKVADYQTEAFDLAIYPNKGKALSYPIIGLVDETLEFFEKCIGLETTSITVIHNTIDAGARKRLQEELGDVYWYFNALCVTLNESLENLNNRSRNLFSGMRMSPEMALVNLLNSVRKILGRLKKLIRDENGNLSEGSKKIIITEMIKTLGYLNKLETAFSFKQEDTFRINIEKLTDRKNRNVIQGDGDKR